jgi:hypothetical protein
MCNLIIVNLHTSSPDQAASHKSKHPPKQHCMVACMSCTAGCMLDAVQGLSVNSQLTPEEIEHIILEVDRDGDGCISYQEFCFMMRQA